MDFVIQETINDFFNIKSVITINFIPGISISSIITNSQTEISVKNYQNCNYTNYNQIYKDCIIRMPTKTYNHTINIKYINGIVITDSVCDIIVIDAPVLVSPPYAAG